MKLIITLCFAASLRADTISYYLPSTGQTSMTQGTGAIAYLNKSSILSVPGFDPSLWTLNSITFDIGLNGYTEWKVLSNSNYTGYSDWRTDETISFLGVSDRFRDGTLFGSGGNCLGGECFDMYGSLGSHYNAHGVLSDAFTIGPDSGSVGIHTYTGQAGYTLQQFVGNSPILLPFSVAAINSPEFVGGAVLGSLLNGGINAGVTWKYNYTAAEVNSSLSNITVTPEPRSTGLLLLLAAIGLFLGRRFSTGRNTSVAGTSAR